MSTIRNLAPRLTAASLAAALLLATGAARADDTKSHGHMTSDGHAMTGQDHMMGGTNGGHMMPGAMGATIGEPGRASEVTRTIEVTLQDNYFEPAKIDVKAGETIRFTITNKGTLLHEFGLGTAAMHAEHQKEMAVMMEHGMITADHIDPERMKMHHGAGDMPMQHNEANSALVEPGKSAEVIWKFTKPTHLEFACNMPGHYESGMMGPLDVR